MPDQNQSPFVFISHSQAGEFWLVPKAMCYDAEFLELRDWLVASKARIVLDHFETFRPPPPPL